MQEWRERSGKTEYIYIYTVVLYLLHGYNYFNNIIIRICHMTKTSVHDTVCESSLQ